MTFVAPTRSISADPTTSPRFRRAIYQVHLWTGLVLGLYLLMLSVTGSALVYRLELNRLFDVTAPRFDPDRTPVTPDQLADAARRAHPGYDVIDVGTRINPSRPVVEVRLARGDDRLDRLFDPYTGADLGEAMSPVMRGLTWLALLHDELLLGETGRTINGVGSALVGLLVVTGVITWWPVWKARHQRSLEGRPGSWRSRNTALHHTLGIWGLGLMLVWAISGVYFAFPEPFDAVATAVSGDDLSGFGYDVLTWVTYLHFGRFSAAVQVVWLVVGLLPAVLVVTGTVMWWTKKVQGGAARESTRARRSRMASVQPMLLGVRRTTWLVIVLTVCGSWAVYTWANYREEHRVREFLDTLATGQYRDAHAMWGADEQYGFERFLADWGPQGRHTASGTQIEVVDSTTYGAVVAMYIQTTARTPVALEVDKETMLLAYSPTNEYARKAPAP